jgi:hypothetical protein
MPTCAIIPTRIDYDEGGNITTASLRESLRMLAKYELCMRPNAPEVMEDYPDEFNEYSNSDLSKCRRIGLKVRYEKNWTEAALWQRAIDMKPIAVSILHMGPMTSPSGPGLWGVIDGRGFTGYYMRTPAGIVNNITGGLIGPESPITQGWTRPNLRPRFCPNGDNSGHVITISE